MPLLRKKRQVTDAAPEASVTCRFFLHLRHLSPDSRKLLSNPGALIDVNMEEDPLHTVGGAERVYLEELKPQLLYLGSG